MKILHIVPSYLPAVRYGGTIVSVHGLCRALLGVGHEVDVFTTLVDGANDLKIESGVRRDVDGVGVYYYPVVMPRRWYYAPQMAAALRQRVCEYDLVHVHSLFLHPVGAGAGAAWRAQVPYVISPRGMLVRSLLEQRSRWLKASWMALFGRGVLERAAAVHVTSPIELDEINAFDLHYKRTVVVPNGIDAVCASDSAVARDPNLVLFLGRVSWKKQIDRVISALVSCPQLRLVVAGNDDEGLVPALQAQALHLGVAQRVQFVGPVLAAARNGWYARAGMFVLPSRSENFANTVLEAMAAGCAVIVSPDVGLSNVVTDRACGIVCEATPCALSWAMEHLRNDPEMACKMGQRGRQLVQESYLWPPVAARMSDAYRSIVGGAPGNAA